MRNENGEITTDNTEIQRSQETTINNCMTKMDNLEEMDEFLEKYNLPKLNRKKQKILTDPSQAQKWKL